jgi:hypothetical protein
VAKSLEEWESLLELIFKYMQSPSRGRASLKNSKTELKEVAADPRESFSFLDIMSLTLTSEEDRKREIKALAKQLVRHEGGFEGLSPEEGKKDGAFLLFQHVSDFADKHESLAEIRNQALELVSKVKAHKEAVELFRAELKEIEENEKAQDKKEPLVKAFIKLMLVLRINLKKDASLEFKEIKDGSLAFNLNSLLCRLLLDEVDADNDVYSMIKKEKKALQEARKQLDNVIKAFNKKSSPSLRCNDQYDKTQEDAKLAVEKFKQEICLLDFQIKNTAAQQEDVPDEDRNLLREKKRKKKEIEKEIKNREKQHKELASFLSVLNKLESAFSSKASTLQSLSDSLSAGSIYKDQISRIVSDIEVTILFIKSSRELYQSLPEAPLDKSEPASSLSVELLSEKIRGLKETLASSFQISELEWSKEELLVVKYYPELMQEVCDERGIDMRKEFKLFSSFEVPTLRAKKEMDKGTESRTSSPRLFRPGSNDMIAKEGAMAVVSC